MRKVTAFVVLTATGCQSWRVESQLAPNVISGQHSKTVRLLLKSGETVEMTEARVEGDSIVGRVRRTRYAVAVDDVERVATQHVNAVKSVFAVAAIVLAISVIAGASAASSSSGNGTCQSAAVPAG